MKTPNERLPVKHCRKLLPGALDRLNGVVRETCRAIFTPVPFRPADQWAEETVELSLLRVYWL